MSWKHLFFIVLFLLTFFFGVGLGAALTVHTIAWEGQRYLAHLGFDMDKETIERVLWQLQSRGGTVEVFLGKS